MVAYPCPCQPVRQAHSPTTARHNKGLTGCPASPCVLPLPLHVYASLNAYETLRVGPKVYTLERVSVRLSLAFVSLAQCVRQFVKQNMRSASCADNGRRQDYYRPVWQVIGTAAAHTATIRYIAKQNLNCGGKRYASL